jgi:hypothetical protein
VFFFDGENFQEFSTMSMPGIQSDLGDTTTFYIFASTGNWTASQVFHNSSMTLMESSITVRDANDLDRFRISASSAFFNMPMYVVESSTFRSGIVIPSQFTASGSNLVLKDREIRGFGGKPLTLLNEFHLWLEAEGTALIKNAHTSANTMIALQTDSITNGHIKFRTGGATDRITILGDGTLIVNGSTGTVGDSIAEFRNGPVRFIGTTADTYLGLVQHSVYMDTVSARIDDAHSFAASSATTLSASTATLRSDVDAKIPNTEGVVFSTMIADHLANPNMTVNIDSGTFASSMTATWVSFSSAVIRHVPYVFPPADGSSGQVLHTDGVGGLTWDTDDGAGSGLSEADFIVHTTTADQVDVHHNSTMTALSASTAAITTTFNLFSSTTQTRIDDAHSFAASSATTLSVSTADLKVFITTHAFSIAMTSPSVVDDMILFQSVFEIQITSLTLHCSSGTSVTGALYEFDASGALTGGVRVHNDVTVTCGTKAFTTTMSNHTIDPWNHLGWMTHAVSGNVREFGFTALYAKRTFSP